MAHQVWLIRFNKDTDLASLRFKNSDQDWLPVDLIIYKTDMLYYSQFASRKKGSLFYNVTKETLVVDMEKLKR